MITDISKHADAELQSIQSQDDHKKVSSIKSGLETPQLTFNRRKSDAEKFILKFAISIIPGMPNTRFLVPGMLLNRHSRQNCNNQEQIKSKLNLKLRILKN